MPKITNATKTVIGVVVIVGVIVMLFTLFDTPSSKEQNTNETKVEPSQEDDLKGSEVAVTDSTISTDSISKKDSSAQQSTAIVLGNTEKNADGTIKTVESKTTGERKVKKVKMEVEEIGGDMEESLPKTNIPVFKRKRSRDSTENDELPPPTIDQESGVTTPLTDETASDSEDDAKKEGKKKKRSKLSDEENGPKSFKELDSIR